MKGKRGNLEPVVVSPTATTSRKYVIVGAITLILIVGLGLFLYLGGRVATAGKAVHIQQPTTVGANQVYVGFTAVTASKESESYPADTVAIELFVNVVETSFQTGTGSYSLSRLAFKVELGDGLQLVPDGAGKYLQTYNNFNPATTPTEAFLEDTILDFMAPGDLGNQKAVSFLLKVLDTAEVDTPISVRIYDIILEGVDSNNQKVSSDNILHNDKFTVTVTAVPGCTDVDSDGYGVQGTDLRGCPQEGSSDGTSNFDCNDADGVIYPGKIEICDGKDNDCDDPDHSNGVNAADVDDNLPLELNAPPSGAAKLQGVCLNYKVCDNGVLKNSYAVDANYNSITDACDFFDNDCDGQANEDAVGFCGIGAIVPSLVGAPPGNAFVDYIGTTAGSTHSEPQLLNGNDQKLFTKLRNLLEAASVDCGTAGLSPCSEAWTATSKIHFCTDGIYYIEITSGAQTGEVYKYSPTENLEGPLANGVSDIQNCA